MPHLTVLRVNHQVAAVERMLVTHPLVVLIDETVRDDDAGEVVARARDIVAEVVRPCQPFDAFLECIRSAILVAERKRTQLG